MSGVEVVAAVSAIVSAFHAGSEILKHFKAKRRKTREAEQEFQEKQLQESLVLGEQQIGSRYVQDLRDFGDLMRVGDDIAHSRLQHVTIMMQDAVIKDLQKAAQFEYAILNLTFLHEASIMSRKDTVNALDELKQRILLRAPLARHLDGFSMSYPSRSYNEAERKLGTTISHPTHLTPNNHLSATPRTEHETKKSRTGPINYLRQKRHSSAYSPTSPVPLKSSTNFNYSAALAQLAKGGGSVDTALMMTKDIDEIIDSYQGLHINYRPSGQWEASQFPGTRLERRDTLAMLNGDDFYQRDAPTTIREEPRMSKSLPPTPETYEMEGDSRSPGFPPNSFFAELPDHQYINKGPHLQVQTQGTRPRWSVASNSSSIYSDQTSYHSGSSASPQALHGHPSPVSNSYPGITHNLSPYPTQTSQYGAHLQDPSMYPSQSDGYYPPVSPLSQMHRRSHSDQSTFRCSPISATANSPLTSPRESIPIMYSPHSEPHQQSPSYAIAPFMQPQYQQETFQPPPVERSPQNPPKHHSLSSVVRKATGKPNKHHERAIIQSPAMPETSRQAAYDRNTSIASSDSSGSSALGILPSPRLSHNIRNGTIQSAPAGAERMMVGRPCKDNNYWGFCKGAWSIREDVKKGLALRTQPSGMYNTKEVWECTSCTFQGSTFSAPHPTKNKSITIIDPRISTSECGIRYKWIFLAKSHVKLKANDGPTSESNYGCIICSLEGQFTSVYGGVETLMNHIAQSHVATMSEQTRRKVNCVLSRVAGKGESGWDINIPIFEQVAELAG